MKSPDYPQVISQIQLSLYQHEYLGLQKVSQPGQDIQDRIDWLTQTFDYINMGEILIHVNSLQVSL